MASRFVALKPAQYCGRTVGDGHCAAFVRNAAQTPETAAWRRGPKVRGGNLTPGTAIATFEPDGTYGNNLDGSSHAAILIADNIDGLLVWDQWHGQPVHQRIIWFRDGRGKAANDGDRFFAVEAIVDA
jgi:hypothetical protein